MTSVRTVVALDAEWVDCILTTAFDRSYGASWYWVGLEQEEGELEKVHLDVDSDGLLWNAKLIRPEPCLETSANPTTLSNAFNLVLNDEHLSRTETAYQLRRALLTPDELPDLDAEAADVLVQIALLGEIVYG